MCELLFAESFFCVCPKRLRCRMSQNKTIMVGAGSSRTKTLNYPVGSQAGKEKYLSYICVQLYELLVVFEVLGILYHIYFKLCVGFFFHRTERNNSLTFSHESD